MFAPFTVYFFLCQLLFWPFCPGALNLRKRCDIQDVCLELYVTQNTLQFRRWIIWSISWKPSNQNWQRRRGRGLRRRKMSSCTKIWKGEKRLNEFKYVIQCTLIISLLIRIRGGGLTGLIQHSVFQLQHYTAKSQYWLLKAIFRHIVSTSTCTVVCEILLKVLFIL